jgi:transcriptional regulator with XRE-family HTH domain
MRCIRRDKIFIKKGWDQLSIFCGGVVHLSENASEALGALGERLRRVRLKRDETQRRLAARLGVSLPTYQKLEAGNPTVNIGTWVSVLELLKRHSDLDQVLAEKESLFDQFESRKIKKRKRATKRSLEND